MMDGHVPAVWISDRYSAQQKHGERHQTCLAHLARDTAFAPIDIPVQALVGTSARSGQGRRQFRRLDPGEKKA